MAEPDELTTVLAAAGYPNPGTPAEAVTMLLGELAAARNSLRSERDETDGYRDWSNELTAAIPEHFEDDVAQEAIISRWLADLVDAARRVLADPADATNLACLRYCLDSDLDEATIEAANGWHVERNKVANGG